MTLRMRHAHADQARREAAVLGWPEARGRGQAKVLSALAAGASTRAEVQSACGVKARACYHHLRRLLALGLVAKAGRQRRGKGGGRGYPQTLWAVAPWLLARRGEMR